MEGEIFHDTEDAERRLGEEADSKEGSSNLKIDLQEEDIGQMITVVGHQGELLELLIDRNVTETGTQGFRSCLKPLSDLHQLRERIHRRLAQEAERQEKTKEQDKKESAGAIGGKVEGSTGEKGFADLFPTISEKGGNKERISIDQSKVENKNEEEKERRDTLNKRVSLPSFGPLPSSINDKTMGKLCEEVNAFLSWPSVRTCDELRDYASSCLSNLSSSPPPTLSAVDFVLQPFELRSVTVQRGAKYEACVNMPDEGNVLVWKFNLEVRQWKNMREAMRDSGFKKREWMSSVVIQQS